MTKTQRLLLESGPLGEGPSPPGRGAGAGVWPSIARWVFPPHWEVDKESLARLSHFPADSVEGMYSWWLAVRD